MFKQDPTSAKSIRRTGSDPNDPSCRTGDHLWRSFIVDRTVAQGDLRRDRETGRIVRMTAKPATQPWRSSD